MTRQDDRFSGILHHLLLSLIHISFSRLDSVIHASHFLAEMYDGPNTLYKDETENMYILTLAQGEHPSSDFNRICNMLSEYGSPEQGGGISLAFLEEHCDMIPVSYTHLDVYKRQA